MTALAADRQRRRRAVPWLRRRDCLRAASVDLQFADLVQLRKLGARVSDGHAVAAHAITDPELVLGVRGLADRDRELALLATDRTVDAKHVPEVAVAALIERPREPDPGLHRHEDA